VFLAPFALPIATILLPLVKDFFVPSLSGFTPVSTVVFSKAKSSLCRILQFRPHHILSVTAVILTTTPSLTR